jgi:hypothetical protein
MHVATATPRSGARCRIYAALLPNPNQLHSPHSKPLTISPADARSRLSTPNWRHTPPSLATGWCRHCVPQEPRRPRGSCCSHQALSPHPAPIRFAAEPGVKNAVLTTRLSLDVCPCASERVPHQALQLQASCAEDADTMARKEHATSRVGYHVQVLVVVCPAATAAPLSTERACGAVSSTLKRR